MSRSFVSAVQAAVVGVFMLVPAGIAQDIQTIAVIDFEPRGINPHEAAIIAERFRGHLVKSGTFKVMERGQMEAILQEQGFQNSGACTDASCVVEMGQLLSVSKMITGSVGKIGTIYTIDIKLLDIKTGQIQMTQSEDVRGSIEDVLLSAVPKIAESIVKGTANLSITVGYLSVASTPEGASVKVNGEERGTTPVKSLELDAGQYAVGLALDGFVAQERSITILKGKTQSLEFTLSPTSERLAAQKEQSSAKKRKLGTGLRIAGAAVAALGAGAAAFFWISADNSYEEYSVSTSSQDAAALWDETSSSTMFGNVSALVGGLGVLFLGVSFAF